MVYGVYNLFNHQVSMPNNPFAPATDSNVRLAQAPANPREFQALARQMAEILKPESPDRETSGENGPPILPSLVVGDDNP